MHYVVDTVRIHVRKFVFHIIPIFVPFSIALASSFIFWCTIRCCCLGPRRDEHPVVAETFAIVAFGR